VVEAQSAAAAGLGRGGRRFADRLRPTPRTAVGMTFMAAGAITAWSYVIGPAMSWVWHTANPRDEVMADVFVVLLAIVVCTVIYGAAAFCCYVLYDIGSSIIDGINARAAALYEQWKRDVEALRRAKPPTTRPQTNGD
jgi:hypothetical protein